MKLDLGCSDNTREGFVGVDKDTHDLNVFPYPWESESVSEVWMSHILEHLEDPVEVLREVYRILQFGGIVTIKVPHASSRSMWAHAEHKHAFSMDWVGSVISGDGGSFKPVGFHLLEKRLHYSYTNYRKGNSKRLHERIIDFFISINPRLFERVFIYWVGGVEEIEWVLIK